MKLRKSYLVTSATVLLLAGSGLAFLTYTGTLGPFLLFDISYLLLILLALPKPRLYVYTFLSLFLFLGFWMKFMVHTIVGYNFTELIGSFDGSGASWDQALLVSSSAALGLIVVRCLYLLYVRYSLVEWVKPPATGNVPIWYSQLKKPLWVGTVLLVLALNGWNMVAAFYQIGVEPKVVLPLHLNAAVAWLVNIGFALWIAALVYWETSERRSTLSYTLLAPIAEGAVSTISQLSRSVYVLHTIPYIFVLAERRLGLRSALTKRAVKLLTVLFILGFVLSLVAVSGLRIYTYPIPVAPPTSTAENTADSAPITFADVDQDTRDAVVLGMARQVSGLFVDRWVGVEGVLAVSAHPDLGRDLFIAGILEDPNIRESSIYQTIAGAGSLYGELAQFNFITLPGSVAVLYYSGSLLVVGAGIAVVFLVLMGIELVSSRFIGNPFLLSVSGMAMANVISQLYNPYLAGVFLAELVVALAFIWLIQTISPSEPVEASNESA